MEQNITPSSKSLSEALEISGEILRNIELSELDLATIALKTARLARLLKDFEFQRIMELEVSGYPTNADNFVPPDSFELAKKAGRRYEERDLDSSEVKEYVFLESISRLEEQIRHGEVSLAAAKDADISISSANPNQYVFPPLSLNRLERQAIQTGITISADRLASRKVLIYQYVLKRHYELSFSGIADDIFTRIRKRVDRSIGETIPDSIKRLTSVFDNLHSDNPENWSNAVHSCRRILQDLADSLFPPTKDRTKVENGKEIVIKLGKEHYINRLIAYIENNSDSNRFIDVVGSHLSFIGKRLDSIFKAAQKGSHSTIITREEADRYVIYTYLLVGDILTLKS